MLANTQYRSLAPARMLVAGELDVEGRFEDVEDENCNIFTQAFNIKFTCRKHPRYFWAALLCLFVSLTFVPFLHDGSGHTLLCGEHFQGELTQCPFEVFPGSTTCLQ